MDLISQAWEWVARPIAELPWAFWRDGQWREFWLGTVFSLRLVILYYLPLIPLVALAPPARTRAAIILTGVLFLTYVFGAFYALVWLFVCVAFHTLGERFAVEARRTDVIPWGPPLAAFGTLALWHVGMQFLARIPLPAGWDAWLLAHAPWAYPLGLRGFAWEPDWLSLRSAESPRLFAAAFWHPHYIGAAYLTMRMLSYLSEIKRDTIARQRRTLESFLAWLFYPPTMIQGPLERFAEFQDALDHCHERRGAGMIAAGVARMALGAGKCLASLLYLHPFVVGQLGLYTHNTYFDHPERIQSYAVLLFGGHAMIFALYLEFSGYCDFAAGMSRLIGYRPIENFRWWLLSTSLVDLWRRWHISLSFMLRDYIFTPLVRRRLTPTLCLLITFLLCGLWHMLISGMLWWGVTMGLAVALNQKWSRWMRDLDRKPHRRLAATRRAWLRLRPLPAVCAWALTIHAFCVIAWFFFGNGGALRVAWELLRRPLAWAGVIAP